MTLGQRLLELRSKMGLSQDALADILSVSRQAVSKWERDEASPDIENLMKISEYFGVSLDYLLKGEGPSPSGAGNENGGLYHEPDAFDKFGEFVKNKWYYIGYLLIAWGLFNFAQFVVIMLFTVAPFSVTIGLDNLFQLFISFPILFVMYSGVKVAVGILIVRYGKRHARRRQ